MLDIKALVRQDCQTGGLLHNMTMKRVSTREFLRNINSMTEPVQVFSREQLKGTWLPGPTWEEAFIDNAAPDVPTSEPAAVGTDEAPERGSLRASSVAPKRNKH